MYHRRSLRIIFQMLRNSTALAASSKQCFTISKNASNLCSIYAQQRLYSVQPTIEEMIVSYDEVKNATSNKGILIVDVREPDEIKEHGKIPNSINIPLGDVTKVLGSMPEKEFETTYKRPKPLEDSPIIFYCMIGKRSGMAQQNALNLGFKKQGTNDITPHRTVVMAGAGAGAHSFFVQGDECMRPNSISKIKKWKMPKRSAEDLIEHYERKIAKISRKGNTLNIESVQFNIQCNCVITVL